MAAERRMDARSLPPDYVSLAQLQKIWLQKQEEMKLKQKQEEEEKNKAATSLVDYQDQCGLGTDGQGEMGDRPPMNITEGMKDKGKGKAIDGFENGEDKNMMTTTTKKKMSRKKRKYPKKYVGGDASEKGNDEESGCQDVETNHSDMATKEVSRALRGERSGKELSRGGWKGRGGAENVAVIDVLPVDAENWELPRIEKRVSRGGRGITRGSGLRSKQKYRFESNRVKESEMRSSAEVEEVEKVHGRMWIRKGDGNCREKSYGLKASGSDVLEAKEVEVKSKEKTKDEHSELLRGIQSLNIKDRERISGQRRDGRESTEGVDRASGKNEDNVRLEKVDDVFSGIKSVNLHGKERVGNGDGAYTNSSEDNGGKFWNSNLRDGKASNTGSRREKKFGYHQKRYASSGRLWGNRRMEHRESSFVWLKKGEKSSANPAASATLEFTGDQTDEKHSSGGL